MVAGDEDLQSSAESVGAEYQRSFQGDDVDRPAMRRVVQLNTAKLAAAAEDGVRLEAVSPEEQRVSPVALLTCTWPNWPEPPMVTWLATLDITMRLSPPNRALVGGEPTVLQTTPNALPRMISE